MFPHSNLAPSPLLKVKLNKFIVILCAQRMLGVDPHQFFILDFPISSSIFSNFYLAEDYDEELATVHVRRLLDIVACTTSFGPSAIKETKNEKNVRATAAAAALDTKSSKKSSKNQGNNKQQSSPPSTPTPPPTASQQSSKDAASIEGEGEMSSSCPKLGSFYEFFSLSHLTPPLQCKQVNPLLLFYYCYY